jgi:cytochrome c peroxidase
MLDDSRKITEGAMIWKITGTTFIALLLLWTAALGVDSARPAGQPSKDVYHRPDTIPFPSDNPYSTPKAELGKTLFFDTIMSGGRTRACGTCHDPKLAWGDGRPRAVGEQGHVLALRSPTLLNIAWVPVLGWDGKFKDLESVAFNPIVSPDNMNMPEAELLRRLRESPRYVEAFAKAFGKGDITRRKVELALATFERTIISGTAPFDRWINGDDRAISASAKRGFTVFNTKGQCQKCHEGWAFTDGSFHDIGSAHGSDIGRARFFPTSVKLRYAFKTPTLRDVALRAPYMHDGSVATLEEVIALYDRGGIDRPSRSNLIHPLGLTGEEKSDLVAFLKTLTSERASAPKPIVAR